MDQVQQKNGIHLDLSLGYSHAMGSAHFVLKMI